MEPKEKIIKIKTSDKKIIEGILGIAKDDNIKLVIFVHGFTGQPNEHIFFNGSKFITTKGFDTFRFSLYAGNSKNTRHFNETSITKHGEDINTIIKFFKKKYKKIFLVGHSYGGTSLMFTDQSKIDGYVFWDASFIIKKSPLGDMVFNENIDKYITDFGIEILVGKKFVEELNNFPDCGDLIKKIQKPVLFITAGKNGNLNPGMKYFKNANNPKKIINIKNADHNFNSWKDEEELLKQTYLWLKNLI